MEVAADAQQGKRAGYMLPEIDRFLHEHQTDWKEMLPYGSATADTVQNLLSTHRLVLVEKELAAGLWCRAPRQESCQNVGMGSSKWTVAAGRVGK